MDVRDLRIDLLRGWICIMLDTIVNGYALSISYNDLDKIIYGHAPHGHSIYVRKLCHIR